VLVPQYTFESLSPHEFEELSRDLLQAELKITLESFKSGQDQGIDLRYANDPSDTMIVQCKHYFGSGIINLKSHLRTQEAKKVMQLKPMRYVITTSVPLNPNDKTEIKNIFEPYCKTTSDIYGRDDLNNLLGVFPEVEKRHFKLWLTSTAILERVLHGGIVNQTLTTLEQARRKLRLYVQNQSFSIALKIFEVHPYCVIAGLPGIGKTTLAEILLLDHVERGFEPVRIMGSISEAFDLLKAETRQIFYFDDFLGQTAFDVTAMDRNEDKRFVEFLQHAAGSDGRIKMILTTRDYILRQARQSLESLNSVDLRSRQCVIDLKAYTRLNRAEILYNHIYFAELPVTYLEAIFRDRNYLKIIDHPNYSPRIIEWMTAMPGRFNVENSDFAHEFLRVLDNPSELWRHAFERHISHTARDLLIALTSLPARVFRQDLMICFEAIHQLASSERHTVALIYDFRDGLNELEDTFVRIERPTDSPDFLVEFHNPSVRDFLETYLSDQPAYAEHVLKAGQFFSQLQWLWGKPTIAGLEQGKPISVPPPHRSLILKNAKIFSEVALRTLESPDPKIRFGRTVTLATPVLARRLTFMLQVAREGLGRECIDAVFREGLGRLQKRMDIGQESGADLIQLASRLKDESFVTGVKNHLLNHLMTISDFARFLEFRSRWPATVSDDDNQILLDRFRERFQSDDLKLAEKYMMRAWDESLIDDDPLWDDDDDDRESLKRYDPDQEIIRLFDGLR
jgi:Restriction endonuclease